MFHRTWGYQVDAILDACLIVGWNVPSSQSKLEFTDVFNNLSATYSLLGETLNWRPVYLHFTSSSWFKIWFIILLSCSPLVHGYMDLPVLCHIKQPLTWMYLIKQVVSLNRRRVRLLLQTMYRIRHNTRDQDLNQFNQKTIKQMRPWLYQ